MGENRTPQHKAQRCGDKGTLSLQSRGSGKHPRVRDAAAEFCGPSTTYPRDDLSHRRRGIRRLECYGGLCIISARYRSFKRSVFLWVECGQRRIVLPSYLRTTSRRWEVTASTKNATPLTTKSGISYAYARACCVFTSADRNSEILKLPLETTLISCVQRGLGATCSGSEMIL